MNLEGEIHPDGSDSPAGEGTIAYQEKTDGAPEKLNGRSGNGVVPTGNSQAPTVAPRLPREGVRNGTVEPKRDVFQGLTVGDVRAWLADSGRLHHFEQALTQLSDPVTREQWEAMLRQQLSPSEARSFSSVFAAYFDSPIQLRFNGPSIVPVHVFGAGGEGMVLHGRDMGDVMDIENRTGPVGDVSRDKRLRVFKVFHPLNPRSSDGQAKTKRFTRGTQLIQSLHAAHAAQYGENEFVPPLPMFPEVLDHDFSGDRPWVAYRYRPGFGFDKLVDAYGRKHPWPLRFVCDYAAQAAREIVGRQQLSDPEGNGSVIIHRDLKPPNRFATDQGELMTIDYDLSRPQETERATYQVTTRPGIFGTPSFMAPEVSRGEEATIAADIFSFGCELYYMLTGRYPPFPQAQGGQSIAPYALVVPGDPPPILTLPGFEDSRVRGDERLRPFAERLKKDPKARAHVQKVCEFIANEMLHPDPAKRATPMKVAEIFFTCSSRGRECSLAEFLQPENFAKTGFILSGDEQRARRDVTEQSKDDVPIPSRFATPQEMLEALLKGSESAEGIDGAYDWVRDLSVSNEKIVLPPLLKRRSTKVAASGAGLVLLGGGLLWLAGGMQDEKNLDEKDPSKNNPPVVAKDGPKKLPETLKKVQKKLTAPVHPHLISFDQDENGHGLRWFDKKTKREIRKIAANDWYSFSMAGLGEDLGESPTVFSTDYTPEVFKELLADLSGNAKIEPPANGELVYLFRHPEEPSLFIFFGPAGAIYVSQESDPPLGEYVSPDRIRGHKGILRIAKAYPKNNRINGMVRDMKFGKKVETKEERDWITQKANEHINPILDWILAVPVVQRTQPKKLGLLHGDAFSDHSRTLSSLLSLNGARYQGVLRSDSVLTASKERHWQKRRPGQHRG